MVTPMATVGRNTAADATLESRRATVIYFSGSMPVIFFKPHCADQAQVAFPDQVQNGMPRPV